MWHLKIGQGGRAKSYLIEKKKLGGAKSNVATNSRACVWVGIQRVKSWALEKLTSGERDFDHSEERFSKKKFSSNCFFTPFSLLLKRLIKPRFNINTCRLQTTSAESNISIIEILLMLRDMVHFLVVWWSCLPRIHGSLCSKSRSEHKLACCLLRLLCLQRAFGGFDLLLQGWKDFLRKTPCRNTEAQMCSMWWGAHTWIFRKFDSS